MATGARQVVVALDWTPNTNHTGFYVAKAKGFYSQRGLDVKLLGTNEKVYTGSYSGDSIADAGQAFMTPCKQVAVGSAHFAMNSPEGAIGWNCPPFSSERPQLKVVAAVLQQQTSAIVTLKSSGLSRPKDLDGKKYASYGARFEGRIVQQLIKNDGGAGDYKEECPPMLGIFNSLLGGEYDATWVFMGWEGVEAKLKGVELNAFLLQDYQVPYSYAPCLLADPKTLSDDPQLVKDFLAATAEGYAFAAKNVDESARILVEGAKAQNGFDLDLAFVQASQAELSPQYLTSDGSWGCMDPNRWKTYIEWLSQTGLLTSFRQSRSPVAGESVSLDALRAGESGDPLKPEDLPEVFTNEFLPTG
mmetsp:Transcript_42240/g.99176  ORF Transcript_42240/g.99176 Transcript_42240/m.99176 type:complete len:360 (+) Transcript_42240:100-1179(+)